MRRSEIQLGTVYAYKDRPSSLRTEQIVFLSPLDGPMYTTSQAHRGVRPHNSIVVSDRYSAPKSFMNYPNHGWVAAIGLDVSKATLDEALKDGVGWHDYEARDYRYAIIARSQQVFGPDYATFKAGEEEDERRRDAIRAAADKERAERDAGVELTRKRLAEFGIHSQVDFGTLKLHPVDSEKLREVLDRLGAISGV
jgi:hypothetical protein